MYNLLSSELSGDRGNSDNGFDRCGVRPYTDLIYKKMCWRSSNGSLVRRRRDVYWLTQVTARVIGEGGKRVECEWWETGLLIYGFEEIRALTCLPDG